MKRGKVIVLLSIVSAMSLMFTGCGSVIQAGAGFICDTLGWDDYESESYYGYEDYDYEEESSSTTTSSTDSTTSTESTVMDKDGRIPNFVPSGYNYRERYYEWKSYSSDNTWTWTLSIWEEMYQYYSSLERYYGVYDYYHYVNDEWNANLCKSIAESIVNTAMEKGMSKRNAVFEVVAFVQTLTYQYDLTASGEACEYPKYPIETLMEGGGDCEDSSILLATMLKELGYGVAIIHYEGHVLVGIAGGEQEVGTYFVKDGVNYYVMETTYPGWILGALPEAYVGESAYVYVMN